jgi:hypothetical protein
MQYVLLFLSKRSKNAVRACKETDPPATSVLASDRWLPDHSVLSFPMQWRSIKRQPMIQKGLDWVHCTVDFDAEDEVSSTHQDAIVNDDLTHKEILGPNAIATVG